MLLCSYSFLWQDLLIMRSAEALEELGRQRAKSLIDMLCETATTTRLFKSAAHNASLTRSAGFADSAFSGASFDALVGGIFMRATEILHEIGGLPLEFKDHVTARTNRAAAYIISGYDPAQDKWVIQATQHGQPPAHGMPVMQISATTPELREAYEEALRSEAMPGYDVPLHPRQP